VKQLSLLSKLLLCLKEQTLELEWEEQVKLPKVENLKLDCGTLKFSQQQLSQQSSSPFIVKLTKSPTRTCQRIYDKSRAASIALFCRVDLIIDTRTISREKVPAINFCFCQQKKRNSKKNREMWAIG
jgi:hypothetical protein